MAQTETIFAPATDPLTLTLLVLPQASILAVASVMDPLRSANRHLGREGFRWRVVSPDGCAVPLTCGLELPAQGRLDQATGEALIVIAGFRQAEVATRPLIATLRRMARRFALIGGVDAGSWVLARAGLLDAYKATVHWEDFEDLSSAHPAIDLCPDRFVIDRNRATAGGAAAACDLMLHLIARRHGAALSRQVAASFLTTAQDGSVPQTVAARPAGMDPRVGRAIARMEARIDAPEPIAATARALGLTQRRLETLFRAGLGQSPGAFALGLRLAAARRLVEDTRHPVTEIALRCGFSSAATLSRAFTRASGSPPSRLRKP